MLVLYENFAADYETSTLNLLDRLDLSPPDDFSFQPRMKKQSDDFNDDWTKRYSELRLGTEFDLVPVQIGQEVAAAFKILCDGACFRSKRGASIAP